MDLDSLRGAIIVSCQAASNNPFHDSQYMAAMALAAELGGAQGIRADGPDDITAIKQRVRLPIIGINKVGRNRHPVYITPTYEAARAVARAGADVIATDGTGRPRPNNGFLRDLIAQIHEELRLPVMADVDSVKAGSAARQAGADLLATTLSGYTGDERPELPDIGLVAALVRETDCPIVAEGRYWTGEQVRLAFAAGAHSVVIGTAITNPMEITRRFVVGIS